MEFKYRVKQSRFVKPILIMWSMLMVAFYVVSLINHKDQSMVDALFGALVVLLILAFGFYFWKQQYYAINGNILKVVFGLKSWEIIIQDIQVIRLHQKPTAAANYFGNGGVASLSMEGIIIKYKKQYSIFVSPLDQEAFIEKLKEINSHIELREGMG